MAIDEVAKSGQNESKKRKRKETKEQDGKKMKRKLVRYYGRKRFASTDEMLSRMSSTDAKLTPKVNWNLNWIDSRGKRQKDYARLQNFWPRKTRPHQTHLHLIFRRRQTYKTTLNPMISLFMDQKIQKILSHLS